MGRKKKDRSNKLLRAFETTIPLDQRLKELAFTKNVSVSAVIREILETYFEER